MGYGSNRPVLIGSKEPFRLFYNVIKLKWRYSFIIISILQKWHAPCVNLSESIATTHRRGNHEDEKTNL